MLDGFRLASDRNWEPLESHFRGPSLSGLESVLPTSQAIIRYNQPSLGIVFPTTYLSTPMKNPIVKANLQDLSEPATTLTNKLYYVFDSYKMRPFPNLVFFANLMDMSPRSLQRQLSLENTTFSEIINE